MAKCPYSGTVIKKKYRGGRLPLRACPRCRALRRLQVISRSKSWGSGLYVQRVIYPYHQAMYLFRDFRKRRTIVFHPRLGYLAHVERGNCSWSKDRGDAHVFKDERAAVQFCWEGRVWISYRPDFQFLAAGRKGVIHSKK